MSDTLRGAGPLCLAAGTLVLAAFFARPAAAQMHHDDDRPEVESVKVSGVHAVDKSQLVDGLATVATHCRNVLFTPFCLVTEHHWFVRREYLDRDELQRDVLRIRVFYWRRGYRHATVDTTVTPDDDGVAVRFAVHEGEPTRISSIIVRQPEPAPLHDGQIADLMLLRAGQPLNMLALDTSVIKLRQALYDRGYADATVAVDTVEVDTAARAAAIRITAQPRYKTYVGAIDVRGTDKVSARTVRNSLTLQPGDLYSQKEMLASQRSLYESNLFRQATISVPPSADSVKPLVVTVREAPLTQVQLSAGFNTVDFLQAEQRYTRYNFLGAGRRLDLRLVEGNLLAQQLNGTFPFHDVTPGTLSPDEEDEFLRLNWQASAEFTQPWWHSPKNTIGASAFGHRRTAPGIYIDRGFGASATFTRTTAARSPLSISYRYELTEVQAGDVYFCQSFGVCETATIDALRRRQALSPLSVSYFTDQSNDLFFPTHGFTLRADVEHASSFTLSDYRYNRLSAEAAHYWALGNGALAAHLRGGVVKNLASTAEGVGVSGAEGEIILHPRKRFYAGGSQSVRGYGENQLGPRVLTVSPQSLLAPRVNAAGDTIGPGCTAASITDRTCDPTGVPASAFQPRPTGGTALIEASVEWRFPIWEELNGAVFLDGAFVGEGALKSVTKGTGALTPGFGFRYQSPAGMIRVDVGIRPTLVERLPVVTQIPDSTGSAANSQIVTLGQSVRYDPLENSKSGIRRILDRMALHLSIGQAF